MLAQILLSFLSREVSDHLVATRSTRFAGFGRDRQSPQLVPYGCVFSTINVVLVWPGVDEQENPMPTEPPGN